jgi:hypothetical protein
MDERVEAFIREILLLQGKGADVIVEEVRRQLAYYKKDFRDDEKNKRMKNKAVEVCRTLSRARVVEEMRRRKGTSAVDHLQMVLTVIDASCPKV